MNICNEPKFEKCKEGPVDRPCDVWVWQIGNEFLFHCEIKYTQKSAYSEYPV